MIAGLLFGTVIGLALRPMCERIDAWLDRPDTTEPEALDALRRLYEVRDR